MGGWVGGYVGGWVRWAQETLCPTLLTRFRERKEEEAVVSLRYQFRIISMQPMAPLFGPNLNGPSMPAPFFFSSGTRAEEFPGICFRSAALGRSTGTL